MKTLSPDFRLAFYIKVIQTEFLSDEKRFRGSGNIPLPSVFGWGGIRKERAAWAALSPEVINKTGKHSCLLWYHIVFGLDHLGFINHHRALADYGICIVVTI